MLLKIYKFSWSFLSAFCEKVKCSVNVFTTLFLSD